jgi:hypothetical protein
MQGSSFNGGFCGDDGCGGGEWRRFCRRWWGRSGDETAVAFFEEEGERGGWEESGQTERLDGGEDVGGVGELGCWAGYSEGVNIRVRFGGQRGHGEMVDFFC